MKKFFSIMILILAGLGCLVSCKKAPKIVYHTVRFDVSYTSVTMEVPATLSVADGTAFVLPTVEAEATPGNVFIWTADPEKKDRYDAASPLGGDLTLYAVEVPKKYKIIYLFEFDGVVNSSENPAEYDSTEEIVLRSPNVLTVPFGHKFVKWSYADDMDSNVTHIPAGTQGDIVLRAHIIPATYKVDYFNLKGTANPNGNRYVFGDEMMLEALDAEGFVCFAAKKDPTFVVEALTPEFVEEHQDKLLDGGCICLTAKWSNEQ